MQDFLGTAMAEYEPGVCNIGARERRRRRWLGITGFVMAGAYLASVVYADLPAVLALGTFAFLLPGFLGVLQDRASFCAAFAITEQYDFSGSGGDSGTVRDKSAVPKDRVQATKLVVGATLGAAVTTGACFAVATVLLAP
jgi:hypothetical protein